MIRKLPILPESDVAISDDTNKHVVYIEATTVFSLVYIEANQTMGDDMSCRGRVYPSGTIVRFGRRSKVSRKIKWQDFPSFQATTEVVEQKDFYANLLKTATHFEVALDKNFPTQLPEKYQNLAFRSVHDQILDDDSGHARIVVLEKAHLEFVGRPDEAVVQDFQTAVAQTYDTVQLEKHLISKGFDSCSIKQCFY